MTREMIWPAASANWRRSRLLSFDAASFPAFKTAKHAKHAESIDLSRVSRILRLTFIPIEIGEGLALFRQLLEQWGGRPQFAVTFMEFEDAIIDLLQSDRIGIPHRPAAPGGITVAVDINDIDIDRPQ